MAMLNCDQCDYSTNQRAKDAKRKLTRHKEAIHCEKKNKCTNCNVKFSHQYKVTRHTCALKGSPSPVIPRQGSPPTPPFHVSPDHGHQVHPDRLHQVTPDRVHPVTPDRVHPVTPDHVHPVTPDHVHPVTPDHVHPVTPDHVHPVTPDRAYSVTPDCVHPVTPNRVDPVSLGRDHVSPVTPVSRRMGETGIIRRTKILERLRSKTNFDLNEVRNIFGSAIVCPHIISTFIELSLESYVQLHLILYLFSVVTTT